MDEDTPKAIFMIIILIVGFAVAGLLYTFVSVISGQTFELVEDDLEAISSYTSVNTTFTADNTTWTLIHAALRSDSLTIYNTTGWTDNTSDFSVNYTTGYVLLIDENASLNGTTMQAIYQYDDGLVRSAIQSGIASTFEANQQIANYMPIIVLAIIITLVIGLIISGIASKIMVPGAFGRYENQGLL